MQNHQEIFDMQQLWKEDPEYRIKIVANDLIASHFCLFVERIVNMVI